MALTPCTDLSAASWIVDSDLPWQTLVTFGPSGFPAYARLRFLPDPAHPGQREDDVGLAEGALSETEQLRAVLDTLASSTGTPEECYACLWDGWGEAVPRSALGAPQVTLPNRAYYLVRGALSDTGDWGSPPARPGRPRLPVPDPAFVWPADRAWCIANDVDPHWAGIGAQASAIDRLVADPRLDVVPVDPAREPPFYL